VVGLCHLSDKVGICRDMGGRDATCGKPHLHQPINLVALIISLITDGLPSADDLDAKITQMVEINEGLVRAMSRKTMIVVRGFGCKWNVIEDRSV
jgi:hypothetical protein